LLILIRSEAI